jgi:hypothetical protein
MEYKLLFIILLIVLIIYKNSTIENMADLTPEAIQNIASVYNKDNLNVTNMTTSGNLKAGNMETDKLKTNTIQLGNKWLITAGKDVFGSNDDWLRLGKADGSAAYGGGFAGSNLWANDRITASNATINNSASIANATIGNGTISNLNVGGNITIGGRLISQRLNMNCSGYDLHNGQISNTNSLHECSNRCQTAFGSHIGAVTRRKSDGYCWCKTGCNGPSLDTGLDSMVLY